MRKQLLIAFASIALPFAAGTAFAAGEGGGGAEQCTNGKVWDAATQKCVEKTTLNEHDRLYDEGRTLAKSGRYGEAIVQYEAFVRLAPGHADAPRARLALRLLKER